MAPFSWILKRSRSGITTWSTFVFVSETYTPTQVLTVKMARYVLECGVVVFADLVQFVDEDVVLVLEKIR